MRLALCLFAAVFALVLVTSCVKERQSQDGFTILEEDLCSRCIHWDKKRDLCWSFIGGSAAIIVDCNKIRDCLK